MYRTCPKCTHSIQAEAAVGESCPACGLLFRKWMQQQFRSVDPLETHARFNSPSPSIVVGRIRELLFSVPDRVDAITFWGRCVIFVLFVVWGWHFILMDYDSNEIGRSFMHNINLAFHEFGHLPFRLLGEFMMYLGGSLFQVMMPLIVTGAFVWKNQDNFGASIGLWWTGQSLMDVAPYINDARDRQLMLTTGGTGEDHPGAHDWFNILWDLGLLESDHAIAGMVDFAGSLIMLMAMSWGAYILYLQKQKLK